MKTLDIDVLIVKNEKKLKRYSKSFKVDQSMTIEEIKMVIKGEINFPHEIIKEEFFYNSNELREDETVQLKSGNKYIITIK